jgi:hypothetical protein
VPLSYTPSDAANKKTHGLKNRVGENPAVGEKVHLGKKIAKVGLRWPHRSLKP